MDDNPTLDLVVASSLSPDSLVTESASELSMQCFDEGVQETRLPVFGDVMLSEREFDIVDHPAFQRLFDFNQLGQTNLVFRGATHRRGEHALGTLHVASFIAQQLNRTARQHQEESVEESADNSTWIHDVALTRTEVRFLRLAALLHDIGHVAAGHTLEDELGLFVKHDSIERIEAIFARKRWRGVEREPLGTLVDRLYAEEALDAEVWLAGIDEDPLPASRVVRAIVASDEDAASYETSDDFRLQVLRDIVGNTICADLLDYLHRDWWHLGKPRHFDPRIVDYMQLRRRGSRESGEREVVINAGNRRRPKYDAVTLIFDLLESRFQLNQIVLFHRTKLAASSMLERALAELFEELKIDPDEYLELLLEWSDAELLSQTQRLAEEQRLSANKTGKPRVDAAIQLLRSLRTRDLHKELDAVWADDQGEAVIERVVKLYQTGGTAKSLAEKQQNRRIAARNRLSAMRMLETDFGLREGSLTMYCLRRSVNSKIARVRVLYDMQVDTLAGHEKSGSLTGGYLAAQQKRYFSMWHASLFIDESTDAELSVERRRCLISVFRHGVLGMTGLTGDSAVEMEALAAAVYGNQEDSPDSHLALADEGLQAARAYDVALAYPSGVLCLRSYLTER